MVEWEWVEAWTTDFFETRFIVGANLVRARFISMKKRIKRTVLLSATLLALTIEVAAQDLPVLGQGNLSCSSWSERRAGDAVDAATMVAWVLGYVTAYNHYGVDQEGDVSGGQRTEELTKWIDDYCRTNPTDSFYGATAALIRKLRETASP